MKPRSQRLSELQAIFEQRTSESWPVPAFERGDCRLLAEALRELLEFSATFGERLENA